MDRDNFIIAVFLVICEHYQAVKRLWQIKAAIQKRLVIVSGQANDPVQVIDTRPLPVCVLTRAMRDHCFKTEADFGYCAAKDMHYYGFKLGLRISRLGMITHYPLLAARPHDIQSLDTLLEDFEGMAPADKGFIDEYRQSLLLERYRIIVVTPVRKNMQTNFSKSQVCLVTTFCYLLWAGFPSNVFEN